MPRGGKRPGAGRKKRDASLGSAPQPAQKRAPGRPSGYDPAFAAKAQKLAELGATDLEVADFFEVNVATVYRWKATIPEFCEALKSGKVSADDRVERSLYHRAIGYSYDAVKILQDKGTPVIVPYREHVPPDTTAGIFWLKNRRKEEWRDKQVHEHSGPDGKPIQTEEVSARDVLAGRIAGLSARVREDDGPSKPH